MRGRWVLLCLFGCGRVGFDALGGDPLDPLGDGPGGGQTGAWQFQAADGVSPNGATTAAVQLGSPSTEGQLIIVSANTGLNLLVTSLTDDAGNTYQPVDTSRADSSTTNDTVVFWYAANAKPGATTVTANAAEIWTFAVWQFDVVGAVTVDAAAALSNQGSDMMPSAPPLETAHAGDIVVTSVIVRGQVTAIDDAYQLDSTANANGFAHLVDTQAPPGTYQAVWTQQNGTPYCSSSVAFALGQ